MVILLVWVGLPVVAWPPDSLTTQTGDGARGAAQSADEEHSLEPGKPVERELSGGQSHFYKVSMTSGQYLEVTVSQQGIDTLLALFTPDGKKVGETDIEKATVRSETISAIAEVTGAYRIEVRSAEKTAGGGRYGIKIEALRIATTDDKYQVAAESIFREAKELENGLAEDKRKSIEKYQEALELYRKAGARKRIPKALNNMGMVYLSLGEPHKAMDRYNEAIPICLELGDRNGEAITLTNIGTVYWSLGEMQKALAKFSEALPLSRAVGDRVGEADNINNIAVIYQGLGEQHEALEKYDEALRIFRAAGDRNGEGDVLHNIGGIYAAFGERQKALETYNEALHVSRIVGDRNGVALTLTDVGVLYMSLGELERALEKYNEALLLSRELGDRNVEGEALGGVGAVYRLLKEWEKALETFNNELAVRRATGNRRGEAYTLNSIGVAYRSSGDLQKALEMFNEALRLSRGIGYRSIEALELHNIGSVYRLLGETQKALENYSEALNIRREIGERDGEASSLLGIARVEQSRSALTQARQTIEQAISIVESLRAYIHVQGLRASYFASRQEYYESYIDILMEQHKQNPVAGSDAVAFEVNERARTRSLLELLRESHIDFRQGVDSSLLERERYLQQLLNARAAAQTSLLNRKHTPEQANAAAKEIAAVTAEYEEIQAQIRARSPRYAALTQPQPLSLAEIQQQALDEDTLLLEYALGEKRSYLWLVSQRSIDSYELPPRAEVEAAARRVYELGAARPKRGTPPDPHLIAQARALSNMLLGPVVTRLGGKRLVVVAPGALSYLPFAALPAPDDKKRPAEGYEPLVAKHEIVTVPSASVLSTIRREMAGRQRASKSVAVLADPVFEASDPRLESAKNGKSSGETPAAPAADEELSGLTRAIRTMNFSDARAGFTRLAFSRQEAESIISLAPKGTGFKATDFNASRALAKSGQLSQYRVLHFATHGLLNSERPELSGLVFSLIDQEGKPQDGFLRLHEIYNLQLNADLIVLSACETGLGKEIKGEGLIGLTRGFMYSGAPRVVASLWNVDDLATAELMKLFYQRMLKDGLPAGAALRAAQLELSRQKRWASPYFWAGFVLHGEWK